MPNDLEADLRRERLVRENLAARVGALVAENIELLLRINELEHPTPPSSNGANAAVVAKVGAS